MGCCKNCGCSTTDESTDPQLAIDGPVKAIARFRSLAECGFFADELGLGCGVTCQTQTQDEFDGVTNTWRPWYVLCVQDDDAKRAVEFLSRKIADNEPEDEQFADTKGDIPEFGDDPMTDSYSNSSSTGSWVLPFLLSGLLTAGGMWWLQSKRAPPATSPIAEELGRSSRHWEQSNSAGRIVRRMEFHADQRALKIKEDSNGDGEFDRTRSFKL